MPGVILLDAARCVLPPLVYHAVGAAVMAYGFYKVGQSNRQRRGEKAEHFNARAALVPFLQVLAAGFVAEGFVGWYGLCTL